MCMMKKDFFLFIGVATFIAFAVINVQSVSAASYPVASIVNYDEVSNEILITRADVNEVKANALLYPSDQISGEDLSKVQVQCGPYTKCVRMDEGVYMVVYNPPPWIVDVTEDLLQRFFGHWDSVEEIYLGAARGASVLPELLQQPGTSATLMPDVAVHFNWKITANGKLIIKDENGGIVAEKVVQGMSDIDIIPNQLGLHSGQKYYWQVEGLPEEYSFMVLDKENAQRIQLGLDSVVHEGESDSEKNIRQAAYLQLLSDTYPTSFDLYWLSAQLASEVQDNMLRQKQIVILLKYQHHLDQKVK